MTKHKRQRSALRVYPSVDAEYYDTIQQIHQRREEIDRQAGAVRLRRIVDYIGYVQAHPEILMTHLEFTMELRGRLMEWIHDADKELAILNMMISLSGGLHTMAMQIQTMEVAHHEHIREAACRLLIICRQALPPPQSLSVDSLLPMPPLSLDSVSPLNMPESIL